MADVRVLDTATATPLLTDVRQLVTEAFEGDFSDDDWKHTLGGLHVIASEGSALVAHAAVVPRTIWFGDDPFWAGYVEGVATRRDRQREGLGSRVMTEIGRVVRSTFDAGVLSTGLWGFYERCGWERWRGPSFVRHNDELVRTEDDDDAIMVLRFGRSRSVDLTAPIACERRAGDDW
jgi:aminoglycoside 2'-N-acetyltransferase I